MHEVTARQPSEARRGHRLTRCRPLPRRPSPAPGSRLGLPRSRWRATALAAAAAFAGLLGALWPASQARAQADSVCAKVVIEIVQELTLERQAFDAKMRVNNGLKNLSVEDFGVEVYFEDAEGNEVYATSDPNDETASFFITLDSLEGIQAIDGSGVIPPETSAEIHWLIIPAYGAAGPSPAGTLYYVGANVTYSIGGEPQEATVAPDSIYVRPMPLLFLDYFLPIHVNGDNPFTDEVEPPEPFTLGVRVANRGLGPAYALKIESAQPKIIDNEQGLLIGFEIIGSTVDGAEATTGLLADFGDIPADDAGVARWLMTATLQGKFTEFNATFTHADQLGGAVTSLLEDVDTHFLIRDVLIDLPGKDDRLDFFANDNSLLRIYESDGIDTDVLDLSAQSTLTEISETEYLADTVDAAGFFYIKKPHPTQGSQSLVSVTRADGRALSAHNAWVSREWNKDAQDHDWFVNIFDWNNDDGLDFSLVFGELVPPNRAPFFAPLPDRHVRVDAALGYGITGVDLDGDALTLQTSLLPAGAAFVDNGDGTGVLSWTPTTGQEGAYTVDFDVWDGALFGTESITVTVVPADTPNSPPTGATATIVTKQDTTSDPVTPVVEDPDPEDRHFFTSLVTPDHGAAEIIDNQLVYTPDEGYTGTDGFSFTAMDLFGETVVGTATVLVTGSDDLVARRLDVTVDDDGVPESVTLVADNTGTAATPVPVTVEVRASRCGEADVVVGTLSTALDPGVQSIDVAVDLASAGLTDGPLVLTAHVDTEQELPEPDEQNNAASAAVLFGGALPRDVSLGATASVPRTLCTLQAMVLSGRVAYGLRDDFDTCFDAPVAGRTVAWEMEHVGTGDIVRSGEVATNALGAFHAEFGVPDDVLGLYELRATVADGEGGAQTTLVQTLTLEECAETVPPRMVPVAPYPGPAGGDDLVSFEGGGALLPWLVHPGMPVPTEGVGGSGTTGAMTGSGSSDNVVSGGPLLGTLGGSAATGGDPSLFDATVSPLSLEALPAAPQIGEAVTLSAVVQANDSYYGLPVTWRVAEPSGEVVTIAPATWYYANGNLHVVATYTPVAQGSHQVQVEVAPGFTDVDPTGDLATLEFSVDTAAPAFDGLVLWLDTASGLASTPEGLVASWSDLAGAGHDASQTQTDAKPAVATHPLTGHPAVVFDGVDDALDVAGVLGGLETGWTAVAVVEPRAGVDEGALFGAASSSDTYADLELAYGDRMRALSAGVGKFTATTPSEVRTRVPHVMSARHGAGYALELRRGGEVLASQPMRYPRAGDRDELTLGSGGALTSAPYAGRVQALLVYDRALSPAELTAVESFLADRFDVYHPAAAWVADGGYSATVLDSVHTRQLAQVEADALAQWHVDHAGAAIPGVGLAAWLRADRGVGLATSDYVQTWDDFSSAPAPAALHGAQAAAGARPRQISGALNGHPVLRFDGANDTLDLAAGLHEVPEGVTAFVVARPADAGRWSSMLSLAAMDGSGRLGLSRQAESSDAMWMAGSARIAGDAGLSAGEWRILSVVHGADGAATLYRGDQAIATATRPLPAPTMRTRNEVAGSPWAGVPPFGGDVAEVLVWDRALSAGEHSDVLAYLGERYGLYTTDAAWITDGGYAAEVVDAIHTFRWSKAQADAYVSWLVGNPGLTFPTVGLELWLAGDHGVVATDDVVASWADRSPAARAATQSSAAARPTRVTLPGSPVPALRFDGGDALRLGGGFGETAEGMTVLAVVQPDAALPGEAGPVLGLEEAAGSASLDVGGGSDAGALGWRVGGTAAQSYGLARPGRIQTVSVVHGGGGDATLRRAEVAGAPQAVALAAPKLAGAHAVGADLVEGRAFTGAIAELMVWRRALTAEELEDALVYLSDRHGAYHPAATWITSSGYPSETVALVHAERWSKAEADAYTELVAALTAPIPAVGLGLWLRADEGVTTGVGAAVAGWQDLGAAPVPMDAEQAVTDHQPELVASEPAVGGMPVVKFDGVNDHMALTEGFVEVDEGLTAVVVARAKDKSRWARVFELARADGAGRVGFYRRGTSSTMSFEVGDARLDAAGALEPDAFRLLTLVQGSDGTTQVFEHGALLAQGSVPTGPALVRDLNLLGESADPYARPFQGELAELLLYERPLDADERTALEAELADRWGLYHPDATWFAVGYAPGTVALIHELGWSKAQADAYEGP